MGKKDPRVDAYIGKAADFAKPILNHLRNLIHETCPEVEETLKWGFPHFEYKGILCSMASFKNHCTFGFWKEVLILGKGNEETRNEAMGQFGRITALSDLPKDSVLIGYIKQAVKLNEDGIKLPAKPKPKTKSELKIPSFFMKTLRKNKKALRTFENFSYSDKKDYVEWITEAKSDETRDRRLQTALEWMAEGKVRNWKYIKK
jgi:uncharacterized protein YdeI (YjbR/CyaY-like superfamily)